VLNLPADQLTDAELKLATDAPKGAQKELPKAPKLPKKDSEKASNIFPGQRPKTWHCAQIS
jgi:hypothetical protein